MLINNRYRVIRPLGEGGFGHAYLAEDTQMPSKRKCVIKQLKPITTSPEVYQVVQDRFQREAAILEQLGENHPQIPRLYAYFPEAQKFYLVQEWIEGQTLEEVTVPQPESVVTSILASLLPVLDFIHQQGIIHRDLKPENIILRSDTGQAPGQPVLIDFGAVRETMGTVINSQSQPTSSIVIGTPGYMSAEQAVGRPIPSSDLYSLGLTAIYLLTGQVPQMLSSDSQTGELIWQQSAGHVSAALRAVLDRSVQSHPRDRYSTAPQMLQALSTLPSGSTAAPSPKLAPTVLPARPPEVVPTSSASELQTMAVAAIPASSQAPVHPSAQTVVTSTAGVGSVPARNHESSPARLPWFKTLTPLTIGLSVLLIGGSALGLGMLMSQGSVDSGLADNGSADNTVQPLSSADLDSANPEEGEDPDSRPDASEDADSDKDRDPDGEAPVPPVPPKEEPLPEIVTGPVVIGVSKQVTLGGTSTGQIDVYEQPSFLAAAPSYGVTGDRVLATGETVQAETGLIWHKVRFDSGVEGWIPESNIVSNADPDPLPAPVPTPAEILSRAPKYTTLTGGSSDRINIRSSPSTSADSPHYGVGGDPIQILDAIRGSDGYDWYRVAFESGAEGWVRADLIRL